MIGLLALAPSLGALASWRLHVGLALPAYWLLAGLTVPLLVDDLRSHRLPNRLTLPAYPLLLGLLIPAAWIAARPEAIVRAAWGAIAFALVFGALHAHNPRGFGAGDVKLSGVVGLALGWISWGSLLDGLIGAAGLGALAGLVVRRRRGAQATFAFGPAILGGAWLALLW